MNERTFSVLDFNTIKEELAQNAVTPKGRELAENIAPSTDIDEVESLLCETDECTTLLVKRGTPPISPSADIIPSVIRAQAEGILSFKELLNAASLLRTARRLIAYYPVQDDENGKKRHMERHFSMLREDKQTEDRITFCILSEDEMADEASPELASIRRKIRDRQEHVREKLNAVIRSKSSKYLQEPVITVRGDRYCVPVKIECRNDFPGIVHDTSSSGQTLFIEPAFAVEANNEIRELKVREENEIRRITAELSLSVGGLANVLRQDQIAVSYIDLVFAKAKMAVAMRAFKPEINDRGYINIIAGRHPLIEKHTVVPIDFHIGDTFRSLIITGPNTGGKTVTLKTVGLFTLMTQIGMLIPAKEGSSVSVFEGVFADIGDEQSIAQNLSTFSSHMKNIAEILGKADSRSLVLFDELGAGTDPNEGAALAMAILEAVYQMGAITLATTHYSEIKVFASTTEDFENACCEFDVATLRPTYKLLIGIPGKSNAFAIASRIGLDPAITERAKEFLTGEDMRFEDMLLGIEKSRAQIEADRQESERLRQESEELKEEIRNERKKLDERHNEIIAKSKKEAEKVLSDAKKEADKLLSEIRKASFTQGKNIRDAEDAARKIDALKGEISSEYDEKTAKASDSMKKATEIKAGMDVYIAGLETHASVLKEPDSQGKVYVQAGIIKTYVNADQIRIPESAKVSGGSSRSGGRGEMKGAHIKTELDLRGYNSEEAVAALEKYIDDAMMANLQSFSIIHGKGTGVLRQTVHRFLKDDKRVKKFRLGEYGEGDAGVTIAYLKV
ncbi:MAG: endonuclease MutS2 [Clostridia bacterium]|nr:endonuclease MutS2 [Clostridia bacterium]